MRFGLHRSCAWALCVAALLACQSEETRLAEHLDRADRFSAEGKHAEAIISYKNVLQIDPNYAPAHYGLAKAFIATGKPREAYWSLHESVRLDPSNREARVTYAQFLLLAQENEEALAQGDALAEGDPSDHTGHMLRGQALARLKRSDEAREALERAIEVAPEAQEPLVLMAAFLTRAGEREAAEPLLRRRVELERSFSALAGLAGFLAQDPERARDSESEQVYREALEASAPDKRNVAVRMLASFLYSRQRFDEAQDVLRDEIEKAEDPLPLIYLLARLYTARGQQAEADAMLQEATRARPDSAATHLVLSAYRGRQGDLEGALEAAEAALEAEPDSLLAKLRKAELLVDMGFRQQDTARIAGGRSMVDAVLAREPENPDALFVRAKIDIAESKPGDAVVAMRKAVEVRPDWARGHFLLGSALFLSADRSEARAELAKALEIDATLLEARKLLARLHASLGEHEFAIEEGRRVLEESPGDRSLRILVAQSLVRLGRRDEALTELEAIPEEERDADANFALGRIFTLRGELARARQHLEAADAQKPRHPEVLRAMLDLDRMEGRASESYARIRAAIAAEPENARLIHLQGLSQILLGRAAEAEASFRRAIEVDPNDLQSYASLARLASLQGRHEETLRTYRDAIEARPDYPPLRLMVGMLLEAIGRSDEAIEAYEQALELDPNLATAKNNLAYMFAESGRDMDRALDLAQEAKASLPDNPNTADTLGWVLHKRGVPSAAIGYLKEAENGFRSGDPNLGVVRHHLAQAYEANDQPDRARETLQRAVADLDAARAARAEESGGELSEPAWALEVRAMLDRLSSPPATEG